MSPADTAQQATPPAGTTAFRQALRYAVAVAGHVTPEFLPRPTPCRDWDLRTLLLHATDSLTALGEGFNEGRIGLRPEPDCHDQDADPGTEFRELAWRLFFSCRAADHAGRVVTIGGCPMAASVLATAGALEIAVHGWDISRACGHREPIPAALAADLLQVAPLLITAADRHELFAPPVTVTAAASPSDRLAAFLGRSAS